MGLFSFSKRMNQYEEAESHWLKIDVTDMLKVGLNDVQFQNLLI
jgi:hypothetical protein